MARVRKDGHVGVRPVGEVAGGTGRDHFVVGRQVDVRRQRQLPGQRPCAPDFSEELEVAGYPAEVVERVAVVGDAVGRRGRGGARVGGPAGEDFEGRGHHAARRAELQRRIEKEQSVGQAAHCVVDCEERTHRMRRDNQTRAGVVQTCGGSGNLTTPALHRRASEGPGSIAVPFEQNILASESGLGHVGPQEVEIIRLPQNPMHEQHRGHSVVKINQRKNYLQGLERLPEFQGIGRAEGDGEGDFLAEHEAFGAEVEVEFGAEVDVAGVDYAVAEFDQVVVMRVVAGVALI